jgi:hypothetical protein
MMLVPLARVKQRARDDRLLGLDVGVPRVGEPMPQQQPVDDLRDL